MLLALPSRLLAPAVPLFLALLASCGFELPTQTSSVAVLACPRESFTMSLTLCLPFSVKV